MSMLDELFAIVEERKRNPREGSYTTELLRGDADQILKKVGEEAMEVVLAAKGQGDARLIEELADLFYHCLVLLAARGLTLGDVDGELRRRHRARGQGDHRDTDERG